LKRFVIAHDLGTSGNKATLFDADGALVGEAFRAFGTEYAHDGWAEQDPDLWWRAVCDTTRELLERAGAARSEIAAIGFSGQMMGCVALARDGSPLRNAIIWADRRALVQERWCADRISPDEVYRITGHRLSASNSLCKILWIRDNEPDLYARTHKFVQAKDAVVARLTGRFVTDLSDASGTNLLDLESRTYAGAILTAVDVDADKLPELLESTAVVGGVLPSVVEAVGLDAGTPVVIGAGDGACATLGAGVYAQGRTYCSLGSSAWIALASSDPLRDPEQRTFTFAHVVPGLYIPCGTMQAAGVSYDWIAGRLGLVPATPASGSRGQAFERLNALAARSPAGSRGLIFLPYLLGERSPRWDLHARGAFIGLTIQHDASDMARAVAEGVTMNLRLILDAFREQGGATGSIRAIGSPAQSTFWLHMMADVFGVPVQKVRHVGNATSLGAAVTTGVGAGLYPDFDIIDAMNPVGEAIEPDQDAVDTYARALASFDLAYRTLAPVFATGSEG